MICKILECTEEAKSNFPCCTTSHGTMLWMRKRNIESSFNADMDRDVKARELYSVQEAIYYMSL